VSAARAQRQGAAALGAAALLAGCITVPATTSETRRVLAAEFDPATQDADAMLSGLRARCDAGDVIDTSGPEPLADGRARVTVTCLETYDRQGNRIDFDS